MQKSSFRKNTFDLAPEIHSKAKKEELGELCKVYPVSKQKTTLYTLGAMCIFLGPLEVLQK